MNTDRRASDFFVAGGTLRSDAPSYVKRPADDELLNLALTGEFCYVLTARQMGKSSLMIRTARRLQESGVSTAIIDLTKIGTDVSVEQWYLGLISRLKVQLSLSVNPDAWWAERASLGPVQRFTDFLHDVVLVETEDSVVIFIDEIDTTLNLDFSDDFLAAIRFTYNARATDPAYSRLTFVLLGVTTPADLIKDRSRTPFNIGQGIDLREVSREDAHVLQQGLKAACRERRNAIFTRIFYWTNGHPYLTQKLCLTVAEAGDGHWTDGRVDGMVEKLFLSEETRKETNLQFVRDSVSASPRRRRLLNLYRKVYEGKAVPEDERSLDQNRLKLIGLVQAERGVLKVRNEIYRRAFDLDWIKANTPVDWTRRIAIVSTLLVLLLVGFISFSIYQLGQQAAEARAQAFVDSFRSTTSAEVRITSLAGLFDLPGYEDQARRLFYEELGPADQIALFDLTGPQAVGAQLITVVQRLYTDLENDEQGNTLLHAMAQSLRKLDNPMAINMATEIKQWLQGRDYHGQGEYQQAVTAYGVAISLNDRNPGTYFDRGLSYAVLGEPSHALVDFETVLSLKQNEDWQERVRRAVVSDSRLYAVVWDERGAYRRLVALVPTPVSTAQTTDVPLPTSPPKQPTPTVVVISPENADQVTQLARWGKGSVSGIAYSLDGTLMAVACSQGIYLYDAETLAELRFIETNTWVLSVAFSPDGTLLASGLDDDTVRLWRTVDGAILHTLEGHKASVESVAFFPDGTLLASGSDDKAVRLWRVSDGTLLRTLEGNRGGVRSLEFSPDSTLLAAGMWDNVVQLWRVSDGTLLRTLEGHTGRVDSVAFSPDGTLLASGAWDKTVRLWRVSDGVLLRILEEHTEGVESVAFSPNGTLLASGARDETVRLWRVSDGTMLQKLNENEGAVSSVAFSPDGTLLAFGGGNDPVRLWRVSDETVLHTLDGYTDAVYSVAFSPDGTLLAFGGGNDTVRLWRVSEGTLLRTLDGHTREVWSLAFSPDGTLLASGAWDKTVRLWRVSDGALLHTLGGHTDWVWSVAFSPDGTLLASGSDDKAVRLWRVSDGTLLRTLEGNRGGVRSLEFSPDSTLLAAGMWDNVVQLWRVSDGTLLRTLEGHTGRVDSVAFSPDGTLLASGAWDKTVRLWRASDGALLLTLEGHADNVKSVAFSIDGALLASGAWAEIRLWRVLDGTPLRILEGHTGSVWSLTFSPDGSALASGSGDGTVQLWGTTGIGREQ